jgi:hypothetical protein
MGTSLRYLYVVVNRHSQVHDRHTCYSVVNQLFGNTIDPRYNDIGLREMSITSDTLWYQLIPHCQPYHNITFPAYNDTRV